MKEASKAQNSSPEKGSSAFTGLVVLMVTGLGLSGYLTWVHLQVTYAESVVGGLCNISRSINCNVAANSDYSDLFGIPIALLGFAFYLAVLVSALLWQRSAKPARWYPHVLQALFLGAVCYSLYLGLVSAFVLASFCWACTGLYVVNMVGLWASYTLAKKESPGGLMALVKHAGEALASSSVMTLALVFVVTAGVGIPTTGWLGTSIASDRDSNRVSKGEKWLKEKYLAEKPLGADAWTLIQSGPALGAGTDAPIVMVEFSDFECPFCRKLSPEVKEVMEAYPGKVRLYFHHYPMGQACNPKINKPFHPKACAAAMAAICADAQGKFWPMHDALFEGGLEGPDLAKHALDLGLNKAEFDTCLESPGAAATLQKDMEMMWKVGSGGTPLLFINGRRAGGALPAWMLKTAVDWELSNGKESKAN